MLSDKNLLSLPCKCRLREERAAERRQLEADAAWRQLLRSIWTRLRLNQDYGDNAAAHAGQDHAHEQVIVPRQEISGQPVADLNRCRMSQKHKCMGVDEAEMN